MSAERITAPLPALVDEVAARAARVDGRVPILGALWK